MDWGKGKKNSDQPHMEWVNVDQILHSDVTLWAMYLYLYLYLYYL
jgi:hypothetical protein